MKKRILSCVLSAALLLGLTPWSALATDDPPKDQTSQTELQTNFQSPPQDPDIYSDPQPNITIGEDGLKSGTDLELVHATSKHADHDGKTFAHKLTSENGQLYIDGTLQSNYQIKPGPYDTKAYYLAGDLTLNKTLYISGSGGNNVCICLNGHSIIQTGDHDVINVANNVSLSLYDCSEGNAGRITHAEGKTGRGIKFSAGIGNTFDMYGGTITGNHATATNDDKGGGVLVTGNDKGSFNLHGGVITGNSAENGGGVAVSSTDSNPSVSRSFTMDGGTIIDNQAARNGGGVYVENKGSATVSGGEIKGNTAIIGGGISGGGNDLLYITVEDSAKITGNRASTGGGVYAGDDANGHCYFTMTGGEISGNTSVDNEHATVNGGGVYLGGTMTVSGDAKIVKNKKGDEINNVFLPQNLVSKNYYTMTIGGDLTSGASIGVTSSKALDEGEAVTIVDSGAASDSEKYFTADAGTPYNIQRVGDTLVLVNGTLTHKHPICGKKCTHTSKHEDVTWTAINSAEALQNAAGGSSKGDTRYYYLTNDVTLDSTWTPSGYLALDLNGYTLDTKQNINIIQLDSDTNLTLTSCFDGGTVQHESNAYGRGVIVASGATFTMYNVELTKHEAADLRVNGAGVYVNGGTFNMRSGSLVDNTSKSNSGGGGVLVDNGGTFNLYSGTISDGNAYLGAGVSVKDNSTFNMYGGTISGNKASDPNTIYGEGGGVYVDGSTFHMTGGEIKNNSASDAGGGVYVKNVKNVKNSTFTMTGGEIKGNIAYKWGGGGVYVASTGTFIVDGKVTITGNKLVKNINNVYLSTNDTTSSVITLRSGLSKDSRIGVDKAGADKGSVKFATGALSEKTLAYYKSIFSSDVDTHTYKITNKITNDDKWDLYIGAHQHTWNYTAKGNKLTATCSADDCTLYGGNGSSVTINASKQTYDGSEKKATIEAERGWQGPDVKTIPITYEVKKDDGTFVKMAANSFPTAVGTYRASISLTGVDHKTATASVEYTISKAELTADDFTFTAPSGQLVYDGKPKAATVTSGKVAADQITVKYYTETGSEVDGLPTNAGTYTVKINVNETESYQAATALTTDTWKFTIAKAKQTISVPQDKTLVKNGAGVDISQWVSVSGVEGGSPADKLSYALNGNYHGVTLTGSILTAEKNATANTVTIKVTAAETQNYERAEATFTVTVAAKSTETLTHVNMTGWTYGGEPNQPSYDPVSDVIENTRKTTYATKNSDGTNSTFTEKVPTAVGNYTVKVTFETASSVYTGTADFTISPKSLTQKMVSSIQDQTYCANAWEPDVVVTDGNKTLVKNSDYTVSYTDNINAGTAKVKVTGQGNYKGTAEATFVIDPAPLTITGAEVAAKTYDGTKTATINGVTFGGLVPGEVLTTDDYQITDAQFNSANVSDAKKVTVTVALKVTDKAKNYTLTSPTYGQAATISKATQNISVPQDKTLVKNGAGVDISQWVSVSGVEGGSPAGKLSYALDGNYPGVTLTGSTLTAAKNATADTVTIKVTAAATQNYEGAEATFSVKLSDKLPQSNFQFASDPIDKTYGNDSFTMTATGAAEGSTVSYKSSDTNVATVDNTGKVTIVGAGKATITATAAETKDYASASASYTLTVAQAKLTITAKDQSAYIGDKVPELGADSYTVTGLVKGESLTTALTILPTVRYVDENGQKVEPDMKKAGETVIRASGAAASGNYVIVAFTDGKLTVSARPSSGGGGSSTPNYPVSTPSKGGNGSVSSNAKNAASGSTVTITVKPDSGYQLETLAVTDHRGNALKLTDQGNGTYTFTMPSGQVDVKATFTQAADETSPFDDVSKDDYYYDAVKWAADSGITGGVGGSLFGSDQSCTRAQIVTFLWRAAGSPEPKGAADMTDVPQDAYYAKAVAWAMENGITSGTGADRFNPHAACTRAQGMTFLFRSSKASASGTPAFQDVAADAYYAQAVKWAADNGITSGIGGGLFGPDNGCTRAQIVTFLWKLYAGK